MTVCLDVGAPQSCCFPGLACYHVSPVQRLPGSMITFITSDFTPPGLKHKHGERFSFSLLAIIHSETAERPQNVRRRAWLLLQGTRPSRWPLKIKTTSCPMFRFTAVFVYCGFWYLRCSEQVKKHSWEAERPRDHLWRCRKKKLGEKNWQKCGNVCPDGGSSLAHWSVCVTASRQLRPRLHLSPGRRARPDVVPALSRALAAGGQAPLPNGQEGVDGVHTCHQEAKDLHAHGNRKQKNGSG